MLTNKVVVITGGAGLIGRQFSKSIVQNGGTAVIVDINIEHAEKVGHEIRTENPGSKIEVLKMDITSEESIRNVIASIYKKHGKIDALVNNAYPRNKNYGQKFFDVKYNDFCENLGTHIGGYFVTSQQFATFFKTQGFGNILNISSVYGVIAPRFEVYDNTQMTMPVEYAVIKSGLIHLTKYMAKYLKGSNIRVNSLSPGGIFDNQPEPFLNSYKSFCANKGMLNVADIQGTFVFLLSDGSQYINGQNILVDDAFSL